MKKLLACFFLLFGTVFGSEKDLYKFTLPNGTDVIVYENFVAPAVIVGFIFDVGEMDVPAEKCGLGELIAENIIGNNSLIELQNAGISLSKRIDKEYSEILAVVPSQNVVDFFKLMRRNFSNFSLRNFEYTKRKICIREKLNFNSHTNEMSDLVFSAVRIQEKNPCGGFNENAFNSISENDVKTFYKEIFAKSHLSIIICGAIDKKTAENIVTSTIGLLPTKNKVSKNTCEKHLFRSIRAENKFLYSSLHFVYKVLKNSDVRIKEMAMRVFSYELFKFFAMANSLVMSCEVQDLILNGDNLLDVCLTPKSDVSLNQLENTYAVFSQHLQHKRFSEEDLLTLMPMIKNSYLFMLNDLSEIYQYLKTQLLVLNSVDDISIDKNKLEKVTVKQIEEFFKEKLLPNLLYKVRTQYGTNV